MLKRDLKHFSLTLILVLGSACKSQLDSNIDVTSASLTVNKMTTSGTTSVTLTPTDGSAYSSVLVDQGSGFQASNICSRATLFGLTGTASCSTEGTSIVASVNIIPLSNNHRNKGSTQLTQAEEVITYAGQILPSNYRDVVDVSKDDNGTNGTNVTLASRPGTDCGLSGILSARISDCQTQNGSNATWNGSTNGNAGQSKWKLVSRIGASIEVWQDQRTGLLWSTLLANGVNWCRAAGSSQADGTCNANTLSYCAEVLTPALASDGNPGAWGSGPNMYADQKGRMGLLSTPSIRWRLPTYYDLEQADIDGMRFVLPDTITTNSNNWTATVSSSTPANALFLEISTHVGFTNVRTATTWATNTFNMGVRCIGR